MSAVVRAGKKSGRQTGSGKLMPAELMARVRQIQIRTHRLVSTILQGAYHSTFRGTGIEFEEVRPYLPGDEVRFIDWNVTARTGEPFVKSYVEERQLTLQFLVDTSRSMDFGSGPRTKREAAAYVCALLSFVAVQQQDQVGLCLFADEPGLHLTPDKGLGHVLRVVREVMAAEARGTGSSLAAVLEHQLRHLHRRSFVFVVSDFLEAGSEDWGRVLVRVARRHDVVCVRVFDSFEERLPEGGGILVLEDLETGRPLEVDTRSASVRAAWRREAFERRESLLETLARAKVDLVEIDAAVEKDGEVVDPLVAYLRRRARGRRR
ncbi:MAG: DUF58 domain-containing protein [Planctomycetota bacterium]|nr:DUF58 domain-containing protein [Planctomycetota bacterium]